jgi:hypothetical protein
MTKATDLRKHPFFMTDTVIARKFNLDSYEGWMYVVISAHVNGKTGCAFPSFSELEKLTRSCRDRVNKSIKALEKLGLLSVDRKKLSDGRNQVNHYYLMDVDGLYKRLPKTKDDVINRSLVVDQTDYVVDQTDSNYNDTNYNGVDDGDSSSAPSGDNNNEEEDTPEVVSCHRNDIRWLCFPGKPKLTKGNWSSIGKVLKEDIPLLVDCTKESLRRYGYWLVLLSDTRYRAKAWANSPTYGKAPTPFAIKTHWDEFIAHEKVDPHWFSEIEKEHASIIDNADNWLVSAGLIAKAVFENGKKRKKRNRQEIEGIGRDGFPEQGISGRSVSITGD